jgi:hypothetical protein
MTMLQALIPALAPILSRVAGNLFPDPEAKAKAESEMMLALMAKQAELEQAAASIVKAEAASDNWLASSWRPVVMLTFAGLIVARWFGWAAPNLSEAEYLKLWSIVEFGLGGYVVGRSVEKIAPNVAGAFRK